MYLTVVRACAAASLALMPILVTADMANAQTPPHAQPIDALGADARAAVERLADSLRAAGLSADPLYAKVAEGELKQATDARIVAAVRALAGRYLEIRAGVGPLDPASTGAAATALASGVPVAEIKALHDAAGQGPAANADFATALITVTDLVSHQVPAPAAVSAVRLLLARRAPAPQYAALRLDVRNDISAGRSPAESVRSRSETIARDVPVPAPIAPPVKPPIEP